MIPAEAVALAASGLEVTRLAIGTAPIGGLYEAVGDDEASAMLGRAWELGLRFFDTAPLYGLGLSERRLGSFLAGKPRNEYVIATKVGRLLRADAPPDPTLTSGSRPLFATPTGLNPVFDFSYDGASRSLEESLERLGLDAVDVVHIHDPDDHHDEALSGAYRALAGLRDEGVIRAVGCGMNQSAMLTRLAREGDFDCFLLAGRYSLLDQSAIADLLPVAADRGISIIIGGVYNTGILVDPRRAAVTFDYAPADRERLAAARALQDVCERQGVPLPAAAIQFPLAHPAVTCVLTGARSAAEVSENVDYARWEIPSQLWDDLRAGGLLGPDIPTP